MTVADIDGVKLRRTGGRVGRNRYVIDWITFVVSAVYQPNNSPPLGGLKDADVSKDDAA